MSQTSILLVDDHPTNLDVLRGVLEPEGYRIFVALNGNAALDIARRFSPDLILLDVMMPDMDGFETCEQLKADPTTCDIPVVFLTARVEAEDVVQGFQKGGVDYIPKPFREEELRVRVATQLEVRRLMKELVEKNAALENEIQQRSVLTRERNQLTDRLSLISDEESKRWGIDGFVGKSRTLNEILGAVTRLQQAASTSVLISGESGTGKELIARAIHFGSERNKGSFLPVNCSAIPRELADSLFFGHVAGAFTGADRDRAGYFELADGGTLFLDEIGDMPLDLQAKLLRVLEERKVMPVGGRVEKAVDVRVVSATNTDLEVAVQKGRFRSDLYFRVASFPVKLPPLRDRTEDITLLAQHFLNLFAHEMGVHTPSMAEGAMALLKAYRFPGNVRELKNTIERALIESGGQAVEAKHLHLPTDIDEEQTQIFPIDSLPMNLEQAELALIQRALAQAGGNVSEAARILGVDRMKIYRRLAKADHIPSLG